MNTRVNESTNDLSALAWVQEELRKSLDTAHKALRRYLKEAEANSGSDVDAVDPAVLRTARLHVHQGVGALELVNLSAGATLLRASEAAVQRFVAKPYKLDQAAVEVIEKASFALLDYITRMLAGKPVPAVALFPQYQAVQALAGAERVHPADLWAQDWRWRDWSVQVMGAPRAADAQTLNEFETLLLGVMRNPQADALRRLSELCAEVSAGQVGQLATLWKLAAGFFEAQAAGRVGADVHTKRAASRLLAQLRAQAQGGTESPQRLAQDLLFFCAQAGEPAAGAARQATPYLDAVRAAYELGDEAPVDYNAANLGRYDPAWVAQARKRVASAKEVWSAVAGGELLRLSSLPEQFSLVGDSLVRLYPEGEALSNALQNTVAGTVQAGVAPPAPLAMEVATSVLYLEASLEDGDFDHPDQAKRVRRLAQRIETVRGGAEPEPLESWMEELYRRVSDRQTMGSVVQELRTNLSEAEKQIDQFFRQPEERGPLIQVPGQLKAMRGVFSVLDLGQASQAIVRMCDDIERLTSGQLDTQQAAAEGYFDRLASNLGALGFLIDMLSVQPQLAKSLFKFDPETGLLKSLMGRRAPAAEPVVEAAPEPAITLTFPDAPRLIEQAQSVADAATSGQVPLADLSHGLDLLSNETAVSEQPALAASISSAQAAIEQAELPGAGPDTEGLAREQVAQAMADFVGTVSEPIGLDELGAPGEPVAPVAPVAAKPEPAPAPPPLAPAAAPTVVDTGLEEDDEMRGIFLEEAREVIVNARDALKHLATEPSNIEQITVIRRAFHTLKGSSRMVGLNDFGEAGWACEQLYNTWLASQKPASPDLMALTGDALDSMQAWTDEIEARQPDSGRGEPIRHSADALRQEDRYVPLAAHTGFAQAPEPSAEPLPEWPAADVTVTEAAPEIASTPELSGLDQPMVPASQPTETLPAAEAVAFSLDLSALDGPAAEPVADLAQPASSDDQQAAAEPEVNVKLPEFEAGAAPADFVETTPGATTALDETVEPLTLDFPAAPTAEVIEFPAPVAEFVEPAASAEPVSVEAGADEAGVDEAANEQVKIIGPLRISIPLFNIFLNEADELSRRLATELAEWAMELHRPVSDAAVALAHSLAGNSATVGFQDLSHLARLLEHALMRSQALGSGTPDDAQLYSDTAEEIRRLLHQFAAGFLKSPTQALLDRLADQERDAAQRLEAHSLASESSDDSDSALGVLPTVSEPGAIEAGTGAAAPEATAPDRLVSFMAEEHEATAPGELGLPEFKAFEPLPVSAPAGTSAASATRGEFEFDDDLDAVDAVDPDLFPIFEEEAQELLPTLSSQMRDWVRRPGDPSASTACMRTLHTLKGGARLAGAMRLGELAHRLESAIEKLLARGDIRGADVEELQSNADALNEVFEALRNQDAQAYEQATQHVVEATPREPAAVEPVVERSAEPVARTDEPTAPASAQAPVPAATPAAGGEIDWSRFALSPTAQAASAMAKSHAGIAHGAVRVRAQLLDRLVNQAGEVSISRSRLASEVTQIRGSLGDLTDNLDRLRQQLRDIELQAETQMSTRMEAARAASENFDPLEFDRYTRFQEITRMMAESVNDVATVQRALQRTLDTAEDQLATQARLTRDLQDDLLRTRMVEFEGLSDRLYRVVRLAAKETGKQVRLDIVGGSTEVDRGVLDRMTPAFEHLLRNCVSHGIETPDVRQAAGKDPSGLIVVSLRQEGNEVSVEFRDDGAGLNLERIRQKAITQGLLKPEDQPSEAELAGLIFTPGFSTAETVTELAGRGIGMDVVRAEVNAMGGRIETATAEGQGTSFKLVLPLTTAVTQVVMLRCGDTTVAVPTHLIEIVRRAKPAEVEQAYESGVYSFADLALPFFWLGSLLHVSPRGTETGRTLPIVVIRSAAQRVALHVDEVLGNQEVVVKNLGPQLARLPGLAGMTLLASGAVALIYNPVALATVYGEEARAMTRAALQPVADQAAGEAPHVPAAQAEQPAAPAVPLILVVDDSLTVRRVTQRLLVREGYRVTLAKDGLDALERLAEERPAVVLSDIEMPRMDGFDLVRNIRADQKLADLPVVMITSRIAQKHRDYATELGVNHYLGKPYSEEELLALIGHYTALNTGAAAGAAP